MLPIIQVKIGDTGGTGESLYYTLGKLECRENWLWCLHEEEVVTALRQTIEGNVSVQETTFRVHHCTKKT